MRNALTGVERALFWTLVFAAFAAAAAGLAARAVDRVASNYETQRTNYAIVRVTAPEGPEGIAAAETALAQSPYVSSAAPMTAGRAAAILGEGGARPVDPTTMPVVRLIEIELNPALLEDDMSGELVAALAAGGVTAEVIQAPQEHGGLLEQVRVAAMWGAIVFGVLMALIVWLVARGVAARRRELVTVMTDLGATSGQAAGSIADEAALLGLYAGLVGALLAAAAAVVALVAAMPEGIISTLPSMVSLWDLTPLVLAPLGAALASGAGARAAADLFHRQAARIG